MNSRITDDSEPIDREICRSIRDAVGERLQQSLRPETSHLSSDLQHLIDELRDKYQKPVSGADLLSVEFVHESMPSVIDAKA